MELGNFNAYSDFGYGDKDGCMNNKTKTTHQVRSSTIFPRLRVPQATASLACRTTTAVCSLADVFVNCNSYRHNIRFEHVQKHAQ